MFLPGDNEVDDTAAYLIAWAQRPLGAVVDEEAMSVEARRGGGLLAYLGADTGHARLTLAVETDAAGDALRYRPNVFGSAGGEPVAMWHRHPGHEAHDGGPCHLHQGAERSPTGTMSFAELTRALRAVLDQL